MQKLKRVSSLFMAMCMIFMLLPAPAFAEDEANVSETEDVVVTESVDGKEVADAQEPASDEEAPVDAQEPASDEEAPVDAQEPASDEEAPVDAQEPASDEEAPVDAQEPASDEEAPVDAQEPASDEEAPVDVQEPASDEEAPVDVQEPASDEEAELLVALDSFYVSTYEDLKNAIAWSNEDGGIFRERNADGQVVNPNKSYGGITLRNSERLIVVEDELRIEHELTIDLALVTLAAKNKLNDDDSKYPGGTRRANRVFHVVSGGDLKVTAANGCLGIVGGNVPSQDGGAVLVDAGGSFTIMQNGYVNISEGIARNGGGVYVAGTFTIESGNNAVIGTWTTPDRVLLPNSAGNGGGVYVADGGTFSIENNAQIIGNTATDGAGVYVNGGTFTQKGAKITKNVATSNGGGVYLKRTDNGGSYTIKGAGIVGGSAEDKNEARRGAGVYVQSGTFTQNSSFITYNDASVNGGGLYAERNAVVVMNNVNANISHNKSFSHGGGVYLEKDASFDIERGRIENNQTTRPVDETPNNAKGAGVYVPAGLTIKIGGGRIHENKDAAGNLNNLYLDSEGMNQGAKVEITDTLTKLRDTPDVVLIYYTIAAFEADPDLQIYQFTVDVTGETGKSSYAKYNGTLNDVSKYFVTDNEDWAIVLTNPETRARGRQVQDQAVDGEAYLAICINQWRYLQDAIYSAITGTSKDNLTVRVQQDVLAQDRDVALVIGNPYDHTAGNKPFKGNNKNPKAAYPTTADHEYFKEIYLDLHGYSINRKLTDEDDSAQPDGYVIRVDEGYRLTILNVNSFTIGKITGGNDNGLGRGVNPSNNDVPLASDEARPGQNRGGGIYVEGGGVLVIQAGSVEGNRADGSDTSPADSINERSNGGGVYVDENGAFIMSGATAGVKNNYALNNGAGVYVVNSTGDVTIKAIDGETDVTYQKIELINGSIYKADDGTTIEGGILNNGKDFGGHFTSNTTRNGGGVYINNGEAYLEGTLVKGNRVSSNGGGIYVRNSTDNGVTMRSYLVNQDTKQTSRTKVSENEAGGNGGGVYIASATYTVNDGIISENKAKNGGGVYVSDGVFDMIPEQFAGVAFPDVLDANLAVDVVDNEATDGGGVFVEFDADNITGAIITQGEFLMHVGDAFPKVRNVIKVTGNTASNNGGGVYVQAERVTRTNPYTYGNGIFLMETGEIGVAGSPNTAKNGGGVYLQEYGIAGAGANVVLEGADPKVMYNTATNNGGGVYAGTGFRAGNGVIIQKNKKADDKNNVYLPTTAASAVGTLKTRQTNERIYLDSTLTTKALPWGDPDGGIGVTLGNDVNGDNGKGPIVTFTNNYFTADSNEAKIAGNGTYHLLDGDVYVFSSDRDDKIAVTIPVNNTMLEVSLLRPHDHTLQKHNGDTATIRFKPLVTDTNNNILYYRNGNDILSGYYYLHDSIGPYTIDNPITVKDKGMLAKTRNDAKNITIANLKEWMYLDEAVNLCLNELPLKFGGPGTATMITVTERGNFGLFNEEYDSTSVDDKGETIPEKGVISPATGKSFTEPVFLVDDAAQIAQFNMYSGTITGFTTTESVIEARNGKYDVSGGSITANTSKKSTIYVTNNGGVNGNPEAFNLHGNAKVTNNRGGYQFGNATDDGGKAAYYGGIFVQGNQGKGEKSNFWLYGNPTVEGNYSLIGTTRTDRNIYLYNDGDVYNDVDETSSIFIYGYLETDITQLKVDVFKLSMGTGTAGEDYQPITTDYSRWHAENLPHHPTKPSNVYKNQFGAEDFINKIITTPTSPTATAADPFGGEVLLMEHQHNWKFYRNEVDSRLYAYCDHHSDVSVCEYDWKLDTGSDLNDIKMVRELNVNTGTVSNPVWTPVSALPGTDKTSDGVYVLKQTGQFNQFFKSLVQRELIDGEWKAVKEDYLNNEDIKANVFLHVADPSKGNPTDPLTWLDTTAQRAQDASDGQTVATYTLQDGKTYTAIFLATADNGRVNSPCVEFTFKVDTHWGEVVPGDLDGEGGFTSSDLTAMSRIMLGLDDASDYNLAALGISSADEITASLLLQWARRLAGLEGSSSQFSATVKKNLIDVLSFKNVRLSSVASLLAAKNATVSVGSGEVKPGKTVEIPVELTENPGIASLFLDVRVQPEGLVLQGVDTEGSVLGLDADSINPANGRMQWMDVAGNSETGKLLTLRFQAPADAAVGTEYSVSIALVNGNERNLVDEQDEAVGLTCVSGKVTVTEPDPNDPENPDTPVTPENPNPPAVDTLTVKVGSASVDAGKSVEIPVEITANPGIYSGTFLITTSEGLTFSSAKKGTALRSTDTVVPNPQNGRVVLFSTAKTDNTNVGSLFTLTCTVDEKAKTGDEYTVSVSLFNDDLTNLARATVKANFGEPGVVKVINSDLKHTITWINAQGDNGTETTQVADGELPIYNGTPAKAPTDALTFPFLGWDPEIVPATKDATYTARFKDEGEARIYTITWADADDGKDVVTSFPYNAVPTYDGTPTKSSTAATVYTFTGWNPAEIAPVTGNATYTAQFSESARAYTITFLDSDGTTVLSTVSVDYNELPVYDGSATKEAEGKTLRIIGWEPELAPVTGDASYTAVYEEIPNVFTITWANVDGNGQTVEESYQYGETPSYKGEAPTKAADAQNTYRFSGWDGDLVAVTDNKTYTAQFTPTTRTYTITWANVDGNGATQTTTVAYGETPEYDGTPSKAPDAQNSFVFSGWDKQPVPVTGDETYTAQFTSTTQTYTVTWANVDGNGATVEETYAYGATPSYKGATPSKAADGETVYAFSGWDKEITPVTGTTTYTAQFTSSEQPIYYTVSFNSDGGSDVPSQDVRAGSKVAEPTIPTRDNYTFDAWYTTADLTTLWDFSSDVVTAPTTLYAGWIDNNSQGCYVATAVYGSYDCPEVWTLRRFRDNVLAKSWYGRLFIRLYYAVSPTAVRLFGNCEWFQNFFRNKLDTMVANLQEDGFASTPYHDRAW